MDLKVAYLIHIRRTPAPLPDEKIRTNDLTFVHDGEFRYSINGEEFTVKSGEGLFCPRGETRQRFVSREVYYTSINFDGKLPFELPRHLKVADSRELMFYLRRFLAVYEEGGEHAAECCPAFLTLMLCELSKLNPSDRQNLYINKVCEIIRSDPAAKYTVAQLAGKVHLNASYLSALWKRERGGSLSEYRLSCQLDLAKKLLSEPELSIREAADKSGFCDVYYFSRIFRKRVGMTPSDFRRAMLSAGEMTEKKIETIERSKPRKKITD